MRNSLRVLCCTRHLKIQLALGSYRMQRFHTPQAEGDLIRFEFKWWVGKSRTKIQVG